MRYNWGDYNSEAHRLSTLQLIIMCNNREYEKREKQAKYNKQLEQKSAQAEPANTTIPENVLQPIQIQQLKKPHWSTTLQQTPDLTFVPPQSLEEWENTRLKLFHGFLSKVNKMPQKMTQIRSKK